MKDHTFFTRIVFFLVLSLWISGCNQAPKVEVTLDDNFSFAFLTDIHVQPERNAVAGFQAAIDEVNKLNPDFVITGGDLIMDALGVSYERSDSLYDIYTEMIGQFNMPVYNTLGNHEVYGWYEKSGADPEHLEYGKNMYEARLAKRYLTFEYKNWKFFILDSVEENGKGGYEGGVDQEQLDWLAAELAKTPQDQPLVISTHIPLITTEAQIIRGATEANYPGEVIVNSKEVLELFVDHNLKLVLQGHLHYLEDIYVWGTHFITGGAVSGRWWTGEYMKTQEGFLMVEAGTDNFEWDYVDYGWEVEESSEF
jgi:3',5'-cyclic AMP phosphodiesterase CpdA